MVDEKQQVKDAIEQVLEETAKELSDKEKQQYRELFQKITLENQAPYEAMELSDDAMESMYGHAYRLYKTGNFEEAIEVFKLLFSLNPKDGRYSLGLGACNQQLGYNDDAINAYMVATVAEPYSPIPLYYMSECYLQKMQLEKAFVALMWALKACEHDEKYKKMESRIIMTVKGIVKEWDNENRAADEALGEEKPEEE